MPHNFIRVTRRHKGDSKTDSNPLEIRRSSRCVRRLYLNTFTRESWYHRNHSEKAGKSLDYLSIVTRYKLGLCEKLSLNNFEDDLLVSLNADSAMESLDKCQKTVANGKKYESVCETYGVTEDFCVSHVPYQNFNIGDNQCQWQNSTRDVFTENNAATENYENTHCEIDSTADLATGNDTAEFMYYKNEVNADKLILPSEACELYIGGNKHRSVNIPHEHGRTQVNVLETNRVLLDLSNVNAINTNRYQSCPQTPILLPKCKSTGLPTFNNFSLTPFKILNVNNRATINFFRHNSLENAQGGKANLEIEAQISNTNRTNMNKCITTTDMNSSNTGKKCQIMRYTDIFVKKQPQRVHLSVAWTRENSCPTGTLSNSHRCPICFTTFVELSQYSAHLSAHSKVQHQCSVCFKNFSRLWLLKGHMRTHTGERPYVCKYEVCAKAFADKSNLRTHMKIHAERQKNFICVICGRAFAQKRYLHKHTQQVCQFSKTKNYVQRSIPLTASHQEINDRQCNM